MEDHPRPIKPRCTPDPSSSFASGINARGLYASDVVLITGTNVEQHAASNDILDGNTASHMSGSGMCRDIKGVLSLSIHGGRLLTRSLSL